MDIYTIALFGEAEKGEFQKGYLCQSLADLVDCFGNPPSDSRGLYFATQALLFRRKVIFFRVEEEGFSLNDYLEGLSLLSRQLVVPHITAIGLPGVGDGAIIEAAQPVCAHHHSILVMNEADLYDYLHLVA